MSAPDYAPEPAEEILLLQTGASTHVRNFVRRLGMMGAKEPNHAATQRTAYT